MSMTKVWLKLMLCSGGTFSAFITLYSHLSGNMSTQQPHQLILQAAVLPEIQDRGRHPQLLKTLSAACLCSSSDLLLRTTSSSSSKKIQIYDTLPFTFHSSSALMNSPS